MSKNIVLRRNDTGETQTIANVSRLRTTSPGGLAVDWIEEDVAEKTATAEIVKNGRYTAAEFGVYGIVAVHVAVSDFTLPLTINGMTISAYIDSTGKPHISVSRSLQ